MKRFFKGCLLIFLGAILGVGLIIGILVGVSMSIAKNQTTIKEQTWLKLDFAGQIIEKPLPESNPFFGIDYTKINLLNMISAIQAAADDNRIKGIIINGDFTFYSQAHNYEIMQAITEFKKSGKKVYAWLSQGINRNYFLV